MAELNEDDMLKGMADILSKMKPTQKKKLEALMNAKARGIKKTRVVEKLSFEAVGPDGEMSEYEEDTGIDKGGGILHKRTTKIKLFDCGHPATKENFGHIAECGHTACRDCVKNEHLVCQRAACMQKLCPLDGCYRYVVDNINLCKKHARELNWNYFLFNFGLHDRNLLCKRKE